MNMKCRIVILLCLVVCLQTSRAQNTVESIRQRYNAIKEYIANHSGDGDTNGAYYGDFYHLKGSFNLPATGGHVEDTYLYFEEEEDPTEEKIYLPHRLKFATTHFNFAARKYYQEYLYDSDGQVAFIYAYDPMTSFEGDAGDMEYEFRFYMNKGRIIKAIIKRKNYDESEFHEVWQGSRLPEKYANLDRAYMGSARQLADLFSDIEKRTYNYAE